MIQNRFTRRALVVLAAACVIGPAWLVASHAAEPKKVSEGATKTGQAEKPMGDPSVAATWKLVNARTPDIERGAQIAAQGLRPNVPACAQCHAYNGASDGSGAFPRLAGQSTFYLTKQLLAFASGERSNAVMSPLAKGLSPGDAMDVAAYYASASAPLLPLADVDPALFERGRTLATVGDEKKNIQACTNCHGPGGRGELPVIPYLAGQYAHYTAFQFRMWREGFRKTNPDAMADIAKRLDDNDIAALAAYFQQVPTIRSKSDKAKE